MLEAKLPEPATLYNPEGRRGRPVAWTFDDVDFIRASVETMTDPQIAEKLGWKLWRVLDVRKKFDIPAHTRAGYWNDAKMAAVQDRCIANGEPTAAVARDLGCSVVKLRRKIVRLGLKRDPQVRLAMRRETNQNRKPRAPKPKPVVPAAHAVAPPTPIAPKPYQLHYAPIVFAAPRVETETLGDRILRELSAKPLSCPTLATLLGVNEELVSRQLRVFEHEGLVVSGSVDDRGQRYRSWTYIDPSVAESAASLRCGPDSLVLAGGQG